MNDPSPAHDVAEAAWILVTNDDGVESPALGPLIDAMSSLAPVRTVVPDRERSWVGKAMTRFDPVTVAEVDMDGHHLHTVDGYPADAAHLGTSVLFDRPPALVVSGVNIGANHGTAYLATSGTVGAALEATMLGVAAVAFSAVPDRPWDEWAPFMRSAASRPAWERLADVALDLTADVWRRGLPPEVDLLSVNLPAEADRTTPRLVTRLASTRYRSLFTRGDDGAYRHHGTRGLEVLGDGPDTDMDASRQRIVSITPLVFERVGDARPAAVIERFERR